MEPIIDIRNISYAYEAMPGGEAETALQEVSLTIHPGCFTAIVGHNGSGKSTLARHINALLLPQSGTVWVKGMCTEQGELLWEIRRVAGMVFQNPDNQMVATIVEDDVAFGPENIGVPREEIRTRVDESLQAVGMLEFAQKAPHMLSGGQKQRVAIAGVLALKPQVIVMDESTAMLDPIGRREVLNTIDMLKAQGITVLLITHYMEEAARAEQVVVMDAGRILLQGTPEEVFAQREMLVGCGLALPPVAELAARLRMQEGVSIPMDVMDVEEMADALWQLLSKT